MYSIGHGSNGQLLVAVLYKFTSTYISELKIPNGLGQPKTRLDQTDY